MATILVLAISGCRVAGPDIPRFEPSVRTDVDPVVANWSDEVWASATAGETARARRLLAAPPITDVTLEAWRDRLDTLDDRIATRHRDRAIQLLDDLESSSRDEDRRIEILSGLADLAAVVEEPSLRHRITVELDGAIEAWSRTARAEEDAGRIEQAVRAWRVVEAVAADGLHPLLEIDAKDRAVRLASRTMGQGRERPLPSRTLADVARRVMASHVDRPTWPNLVDGGFAAIESSVVVCAPADRGSILARLDELRTRFEAAVATIDRDERTLPAGVDDALDDLGAGLAAVRSSDVPDELPDPIAVFLDGMLSVTDLRTRVLFGNDADMIERLLGATFRGIGARLRQDPSGWSLHPLAGSPAMKAGLRRGDRLEAVDGRSVEGMTAQEILTAIGGRRGDVVAVRVRRDGTEGSIDLLVTIDDIELEVVHGWRQLGVDAFGRPRWDWIIDREAGIAFISIREFDVETDVLFRRAMKEANAALGEGRLVQGLVIDLRDNPGGHRRVTERILDLFLFQDDVFRAHGRDDEPERVAARPKVTRLAGMPVVLLVDERSASASEVLAGTLQGATDAVVLGERTFGKGSVQGVHRARDGFILVTESWFLVPESGSDPDRPWRFLDRARTERWGVQPQWPLPTTDEETDRVLEAAAHWTSRRGQDVANPDAAATLETSEDRALLQAAILLRARLLPTWRTPAGGTRSTGTQ